MGTPIELLNSDLPKWPAMIVRGVPITVEQAREVIRRTDTAFQRGISGNDRAFNQRLAERMELPRKSVRSLGENLTHEDYAALDEWRERWGVVYSEYITNRHEISPHMIGGCGDDDELASDVTAKNPAGRTVSFTVCCGWPSKGCTIRTH